MKLNSFNSIINPKQFVIHAIGEQLAKWQPAMPELNIGIVWPEDEDDMLVVISYDDEELELFCRTSLEDMDYDNFVEDLQHWTHRFCLSLIDESVNLYGPSNRTFTQLIPDCMA